MSDRQSDKTGPDLAQTQGALATVVPGAANAPANDNDGDWGLEESRRSEALVVDIDGFEGPLDLLLTLGRAQKVDLRQVSILQLAEQYLAFVEEARRLRLELAADYLVMAAWLAFLKSRLLLPPEPGEEGPSGEDLAAHLAFQLERLAAMREAAAKLMARDQMGSTNPCGCQSKRDRKTAPQTACNTRRTDRSSQSARGASAPDQPRTAKGSERQYSAHLRRAVNRVPQSLDAKLHTQPADVPAPYTRNPGSAPPAHHLRRPKPPTPHAWWQSSRARHSDLGTCATPPG